MAVHNIYAAGPGSAAVIGDPKEAYAFYPRRDVDVNEDTTPIANHHGGGNSGSPTFHMDLKIDHALRQYFDNHTIAVGDFLSIQIIPKGVLVDSFALEVIANDPASTGAAFEVGIRDKGGIVKPSWSMASTGVQVITSPMITAFNQVDLYQQNDVLQLKVLALPQSWMGLEFRVAVHERMTFQGRHFG